MKKVYVNFKSGDGTVYTVGFKSNESWYRDLKFRISYILGKLNYQWTLYKILLKQKLVKS